MDVTDKACVVGFRGLSFPSDPNLPSRTPYTLNAEPCVSKHKQTDTHPHTDRQTDREAYGDLQPESNPEALNPKPENITGKTLKVVSQTSQEPTKPSALKAHRALQCYAGHLRRSEGVPLQRRQSSKPAAKFWGLEFRVKGLGV